MSILRRQGEKTIPDFIEDDFISAIETALNRSYYYQDKLVEVRRISQADENELGYDGVLTTIVPFYIQFKRSDFYSPQFTGELLTQRTTVGLPVDRGFFAFELLRKHKKYEQHNAMFQLSQTSKAAYVAPMFYKSSDLTKFKNQAKQFIPTYYDDIIIYDYPFRRQHIFRNLLLFKNAITIPPHATVNDNNASHHYSYSRDNKIGFHSDPINLGNSKSQSLYYFIQDIFRQESFSDSKTFADETFNILPKCFGLDNSSEEFTDILEASIKRVSILDSNVDFKSIIEQLDFFDKLLITEDILYHYFNIRQFIKYENA
jgi:hypothetical protein